MFSPIMDNIYLRIICVWSDGSQGWASFFSTMVDASNVWRSCPMFMAYFLVYDGGRPLQCRQLPREINVCLCCSYYPRDTLQQRGCGISARDRKSTRLNSSH